MIPAFVYKFSCSNRNTFQFSCLHCQSSVFIRFESKKVKCTHSESQVIIELLTDWSLGGQVLVV